MPIKKAAIIPHSPVLIPQIGKDNLTLLQKTVKAYLDIEKDLVEKKVETILIISPHGVMNSTNFTLNLSPTYTCDFEEFGDFSTKNEWDSDIELIQQIREKLDPNSLLSMTTEPALDHGCTVPLTLLTNSLPDVKIIPLYYSGVSYEEHYNFGKELKSILMQSPKSIAVLASGDLSHRITKDSPAGFSPKGKKFDRKLIDYLSANNVDEIKSINAGLAEEAKECGLKSILLLLGIINNINYNPKLLSYEHPFGIGYMVMDFQIKS